MFIRLLFFLNLAILIQIKAELRPQAIRTFDGRVFIAGDTGKLLSLKSGRIEKLVEFGDALIQLRLFKGQLYVLVQGSNGALVTLDPNSLEEENRIELGYYPYDFQIKDDLVYIAYRFQDLVEARDLKTGQVKWQRKLEHEPTALSIVDDQLYVVTHLPHQAATADHVSSRLAQLKISTGEIEKVVNFPDGANAIRSLESSQQGRYLYTAFILARHRITTNQIERGWINTNALAVIDTQEDTLTTVLLDDLDRGAPNTWGIATNSKSIAVALAGTNEVMLINEAKLLKKLEKTEYRKKRLSYKLSFLHDCSQRFKTDVRGLRAITAGDEHFHFAGFFDHDYQTLSFSSSNLTKPINLAREKQDLARQGEEVFHNARYSFQQWLSCASCHPDTRADAMNWDLLNDGLGSFRNTKSMLFTHFTPPTTITGCRANAYVSVRAGFKHIQFVEVNDSKAKAVDAYLKSLRPQSSPKLVNGQLSESAKRGEKVFKEEASCSDCHKGEYLTNMKMRDVGTGLAKEQGRKFDVPTLKEVWRTRPYLHDGRATSMKALLTTFNKDDKHGETSHLSEEQLKDLIEYVLSL